MFETVPMQKIRVVGLRNRLEPVLKILQDEGIIELRRCSKKRETEEITDLVTEELGTEIVRLRGIKAALVEQDPPEPMADLFVDELLSSTKKIKLDADLEGLERRREDIFNDLTRLKNLKNTLQLLIKFKITSEMLTSVRFTLFLGTIEKGKMDALRRSLDSVSTRYSWDNSASPDGQRNCIIACDSSLSDKFEIELGKVGMKRYMIHNLSSGPKIQLSETEKEMERLIAEEKKIGQMMTDDSVTYWGDVVCLNEMLESASERNEEKSKVLLRENIFVLEGWIKKGDTQSFKDIIEKATQSKIMINEIEPDDEPPSVLSNPAYIKPFESMVEFLAIPNSKEKDPTIMFSISFMILYGMMLGDVGYGIMSFGLAFIIFKNAEGILKDLSQVWMYASVPTMFFGVLFDEYFGYSNSFFLGHHLYHPWIHRMDDVGELLVLVLSVGVIHLLLGFAMGYLNLRHRNRKHAIAKLLWMTMIISGVAIAISSDIPVLFLPAALGCVVSIIGIIYIEGIMGLFEIPGVIGNIMSYARIMAVGMASVVIAFIINDTFPLKADASALIVVPIVIALHLANTVLGIFESSIQSARLNYAEFFTKFFEGGGRSFQPFRFNRLFTYEIRR